MLNRWWTTYILSLGNIVLSSNFAIFLFCHFYCLLRASINLFPVIHNHMCQNTMMLWNNWKRVVWHFVRLRQSSTLVLPVIYKTIELMGHPPYKPDLVSHDFFLFRNIKNKLVDNDFRLWCLCVVHATSFRFPLCHGFLHKWEFQWTTSFMYNVIFSWSWDFHECWIYLASQVSRIDTIKLFSFEALWNKIFLNLNQ